MYGFITFLLPSLLGIKVLMCLKKNYKLIDIFINYGLLVLISNLICMSILALLKKGEYALVFYANNNFIFCIKYIFMMLFINAFLAILFDIIQKYIYFDIEVKNEKKKSINTN